MDADGPGGHRLARFRWLFNDGQASVGGQGSARLAGPDSMRFDIAGPFGIGNAAAAVVGEQRALGAARRTSSRG